MEVAKLLVLASALFFWNVEASMSFVAPLRGSVSCTMYSNMPQCMLEIMDDLRGNYTYSHQMSNEQWTTLETIFKNQRYSYQKGSGGSLANGHLTNLGPIFPPPTFIITALNEAAQGDVTKYNLILATQKIEIRGDYISLHDNNSVTPPANDQRGNWTATLHNITVSINMNTSGNVDGPGVIKEAEIYHFDAARATVDMQLKNGNWSTIQRQYLTKADGGFVSLIAEIERDLKTNSLIKEQTLQLLKAMFG